MPEEEISGEMSEGRIEMEVQLEDNSKEKSFLFDTEESTIQMIGILLGCTPPDFNLNQTIHVFSSGKTKAKKISSSSISTPPVQSPQPPSASLSGSESNEGDQSSLGASASVYCRVFHKQLGGWFEAQIISHNEQRLVSTVEILGFGTKLIVPSKGMLRSGGEKARQKQIDEATKAREGCDMEYDEEMEEDDDGEPREFPSFCKTCHSQEESPPSADHGEVKGSGDNGTVFQPCIYPPLPVFDGAVNLSSVDESLLEEVWDDTELIRQYDESMKPLKRRVEREVNKKLSQGLISIHMDPLQHGEMEDAPELDMRAPESLLSKGYKMKASKAQSKGGPVSQDFQIQATKWHIGDHVCALWDDGEWYEAVIVSINLEQRTAVVRYIGYNDEDTVALRGLRKSMGEEHQIAQARQVCKERGVEFSEEEHDIEGEFRLKKTKKPKNYLPKEVHLPNLPPFPTGYPPPPLPGDPLRDLSSKTPSKKAALHSMLMAWYMSGYHTGFYHGVMAEKRKDKKNVKGRTSCVTEDAS
ncbi:unnamed protein product [Darwinula stevensoni]|uniref:Tudor domain-containing protein n=1 Tax=Darwinula stevensoni TaxID=69355 RepID=A0A7R9A219_9CRUS|nr:unnamed protein product [Darwinula stevensoni]CAG0888857.1 unnamed protein product [Darwinula stevensoni]